MPRQAARKVLPKNSQIVDIEAKIDALSREELKDLLLVNMYKLALMRAQIEAINDVLIKNKLVTYEEFWKKTNEILKDANK